MPDMRPSSKTRELLSVVQFCLVVQEKRVFGVHGVRGYRRGQCSGNKVQLVDEGFFKDISVAVGMASGERGAEESSCDDAREVGRGRLWELNVDGTEKGDLNRFLENWAEPGRVSEVHQFLDMAG